MREINYNVNCGEPLVLDREYAHNATTITFKGFDQTDDAATMYIMFGAPLNMMAQLTDNQFTVTDTYTKRVGSVHAQLAELKGTEGAYDLQRYSNMFDVVILPSLDVTIMSEETE